MKKKRIFLVVLKILLLAVSVFILSSCDRGLEILSVDVIQLPHKMTYVAGTADSLDMNGCVLRRRIRDGRETDFAFGSWPFVSVSHEIDFSTPGEYEVHFYWSETQIYTMIIQVIPAPE